MRRGLSPTRIARDQLPELPVGSAVRAARAASPSPARSDNGGHGRALSPPFALISRPHSVDGRRSRPSSADSQTSAAMASAPRLLMSPSHPRRRARGDGSIGPLNKEDHELQTVCQQINDLAPQKFTTVREAFRYLKPDRNGMASRSDILYFLRAYGVQAEQAMRIYKRFDSDGVGSVNCCRFVNFMRPFVAPAGEDMELMAGLTTEAMRRSPASPRLAPLPEPNSILQAGCPGFSDCPLALAQVSKEFCSILNMVYEKAPQRFSHAREALRIVDVDYDGCITRGEMQNFFRAFGVGEKESDRFYEKLAEGGPGGANYHSFVRIVGPYLDLPGVVTATQRSESRTCRPGSTNSRGQSTPRRVYIPAESDRQPAREQNECSSPEIRELHADRKQCREERISPTLDARVSESPKKLKPCKGRIATPSPTPRQLVLPKETRNVGRVSRPLSPPVAGKKGARRPLGIQRKKLEIEDGTKKMCGALLTADGRPVATPARRPRSKEPARCPSPHHVDSEC